jgi:oligoribonuclease NrnB/cAMP/cGMP phosphodiesterase (DHH superfamily)
MYEKTPDVVLYHANCHDGFTAAWIAHNRYGDYPLYVGCSYDNNTLDREVLRDKDVLVVDFSFSADETEKLSEIVRSMVILDHHASAERNLVKLPKFDTDPNTFDIAWNGAGDRPVVCCFDMNRSGAGIAWDFLFPDQPRPDLVTYVEDRDLWRFSDPNTRAVHAYLSSIEDRFDTWDDASIQIDCNFPMVVEMGKAIDRKHLIDVRRLLDKNAFLAVVNGVQVWVANMPTSMASDAAGELAKRYPNRFGATFSVDRDKNVLVSLRSVKGTGMDVSLIAQEFEGGGHPNAAGFVAGTFMGDFGNV